MKLQFLLLCLLTMLLSCKSQSESHSSKIELTIIGSRHNATNEINADSIYNILEKIKPDLILLESGPHEYDSDFTFIKSYEGNEAEAVEKYQRLHSEVNVRPIDITARNEQRKRIGIYSCYPNITINLAVK